MIYTKTFKINKHLSVECEVYETRYSWGHKAWLYRDGAEIGYKKITYYNRTWEAYEFESILRSLADSVSNYATSRGLTTKEYGLFCKKIETQFKEEDEKETKKEFGTIGAIMAMGDIFGKDKKEANDWKARMLKAGLGDKGLILPEDWEELTEEEKETRLNGVMAQFK